MTSVGETVLAAEQFQESTLIGCNTMCFLNVIDISLVLSSLRQTCLQNPCLRFIEKVAQLFPWDYSRQRWGYSAHDSVFCTNGGVLTVHGRAKGPVLDFSHYNVWPYGRTCTLFYYWKCSTGLYVGSNIYVGEIQHSWVVCDSNQFEQFLSIFILNLWIPADQLTVDMYSNAMNSMVFFMREKSE